MAESQQTTTLPTSLRFESPDIHINETQLRNTLAQPLTEETFPALIYANYLVAMCAIDHRCLRSSLAKILVMNFNFHNHMMRWAALRAVAQRLTDDKFNFNELKTDIDYNLAEAALCQTQLMETLRLFGEMRTANDPVS